MLLMRPVLRSQVEIALSESKSFVTTTFDRAQRQETGSSIFGDKERGGVNAFQCGMGVDTWSVLDFYARCWATRELEVPYKRSGCWSRTVRVRIALRGVPRPKRQGRRIFCQSFEESADRSHDAIKKERRGFPVRTSIRDG